jgi:hypothetical protein
MKNQNLNECEKEELVGLVVELQSQLEKKKLALSQVRLKLGAAKRRLRKLKDLVMHQRTRILELYKEEVNVG